MNLDTHTRTYACETHAYMTNGLREAVIRAMEAKRKGGWATFPCGCEATTFLTVTGVKHELRHIIFVKGAAHLVVRKCHAL